MLDPRRVGFLNVPLKGLDLCLVARRLAFAGLFALPVLAAADDKILFQLSQDNHRIKVQAEGKFTLTEDGTGIASLARGASMRLEEEDAGILRRLDVEPAADGSPVYTWRINGEQRAFGAEERKWLQRMLVAGRLVPETPKAGGHHHKGTPDSQ